MSTFRKIASALVDADMVRSIRPCRPDGIPNYVVVTYHNGTEDSMEVADPEAAIAEFQRADPSR